MKSGNIFVSDLSTAKHVFCNYHFCRGNSNKRKTRLGLIVKGNGTYIYLNKKLKVCEGDVVFIPESIYCYSEWHGAPEIEVVYVSCFMHYDGLQYEPQILSLDEGTKDTILQIAQLLSLGGEEDLEAYSLFYRVLKVVLPQMKQSNIAFDKTLQTAVEYITNHWNEQFSVSDLAKQCCVSESSIYHIFQKELGETPINFLNSIKINISVDYLENTNYSIATISDLVGFHSENHFRKVFTGLMGITPLKYRKNR